MTHFVLVLVVPLKLLLSLCYSPIPLSHIRLVFISAASCLLNLPGGVNAALLFNNAALEEVLSACFNVKDVLVNIVQ